MIEITLKNCNSIDDGKITIINNGLNIKYGINGTGKSTIAKAILYTVEQPDNLKLLTQFKYKDGDSLPLVSGIDDIKSIMIFDENYINNFIFKKDEIIENSFDIFIKNDSYIKTEKEIDDFISGIKDEFEKNKELDELITNLNVISTSFGKKSTLKGIAKSSKFYKGLSKGNNLSEVPSEVIEYEKFIKNKKNTQWITWQSKGNEYLEIDNCCPFCTGDISNKTSKISKISKIYEPKSFEFLVNILDMLSEYGDYFNPSSREKLKSITQSRTNITKEEELVLKEVKDQIDIIIDKLISLKRLNHVSFTNDVKVNDKIKQLEINLDLLSHFKSERVENVISGLNNSLNEIKNKVNELQKKVGIHKNNIKRLVNKNKVDINNFLINAGYKYNVYFDDNANIKLKHIDSDLSITNGNQHLSYGEKNAFSMLLFMYECIAKNPDLIVLDDPISSFDKNKKYAIMKKLFNDKNSLKDKTVLMLTHDFEPIVDFFKIKKTNNIKNQAHLISTRKGLMEENKINEEDILTFMDVCDLNIERNENIIIKIIYLRRKHDAMNKQDNAYQLLSSVIHKRNEPQFKCDGELRPMLDPEIERAQEQIRNSIPNFNYKECIEIVSNDQVMIELFNNAKNDYEKLQLFRIITKLENVNNNVLHKYINETFHIENDHISQLDPHKYNLVPDFIIDECESIIKNK